MNSRPNHHIIYNQLPLAKIGLPTIFCLTIHCIEQDIMLKLTILKLTVLTKRHVHMIVKHLHHFCQLKKHNCTLCQGASVLILQVLLNRSAETNLHSSAFNENEFQICTAQGACYQRNTTMSAVSERLNKI